MMSTTNVEDESDKDSSGVEMSSDKPCPSRKATSPRLGPMLASRPNFEHLVCVKIRVKGLQLSVEAHVEEGPTVLLIVKIRVKGATLSCRPSHRSWLSRRSRTMVLTRPCSASSESK